MTKGERLDWARAFIEQAALDLQLACALRDIVIGREGKRLLGAKPQLYCPAVYAYCQQAIEKALKAWLWYATGSIPMRHNPLTSVLRAAHMKGRGRPKLLDIVDRNSRSIAEILNMAPGAASDKPDMTALMRQTNTEYPFCSEPGEQITLPHEAISETDVAGALRITPRLVNSIRKYLEIMGIWESPSQARRP